MNDVMETPLFLRNFREDNLQVLYEKVYTNTRF